MSQSQLEPHQEEASAKRITDFLLDVINDITEEQIQAFCEKLQPHMREIFLEMSEGDQLRIVAIDLLPPSDKIIIQNKKPEFKHAPGVHALVQTFSSYLLLVLD